LADKENPQTLDESQKMEGVRLEKMEYERAICGV
jgi:hypothetical protein